MSMLLHIDVSVRLSHSLSREMSLRFVTEWRNRNPTSQVIRRDLASEPPPFVDELFIAAAFTPADQRSPAMCRALAISDQLIDEIEASDVIVIGTPMYNYGLPAALKAWVDQVIRINRTFSFDLARGDYPLEALLSGKALVLLTSSGEFGFDRGGIRAPANHLDTYFATVQHFFGANHLFHMGIEYQEFKDDRHTASVAKALAGIPTLVEQVASALERKEAPEHRV